MCNHFFIKEALKEAQLAYSKNEIPVGAVIVSRVSGKIIARAHNINRESNNPLAHAEVIVINEACEILGTRYLTGYDLYVTLEPCIMCAGAISLARLDRLYFGTEDQKAGSVLNGVRIFNTSTFLHRPEIYDNICHASSKLLKQFFSKIRNDIS